MVRWILVTACLFLTGCYDGSHPQSSPPIAEQLAGGPASENELPPDLDSTGSAHTIGVQSDESEPVVANRNGNSPSIGTDERLSVRIDVDSPSGSPTINIEKSFLVVLKNTSDEPIRIWNPNTENGYYQLSFQFTNSRSGETHVARKRRIEDEDFWKALKQHMEPGSELIEIAPKSDFRTPVHLNDFKWGERAWTGLPSPNSTHPFSISVQVESTAVPDGLAPTVWIGKIESNPVTASLIAPRLKTPHDYLGNGFPEEAIEMMNDDPKWINTQDENECTPLHHAAQLGYTNAVKWLLDHGANVNAIAINGFTPLHLTDDLDVIQLILQKKPDLTIRCRSQGQTPMQRAAEHLVDARRANEREKWRQIVKTFQNAGADYDILTAIHLDDLERIQAILKKSPNLADNFQEESPLRTAASLGRLEICRYLIDEHHADVNDFERGLGYPIIKEALAYPQVVTLLIDNGADLKTRITWRGGRTGVWIIGDDATALHYAASDGVPETVKMLIDSGVDIFATAHDSFDKNSRQTALEVAAFFGKADNARAIVSHPKFDAADRELRQALLDKCLRIGASPSWLARDAQRPKLIKALLDKGANPNAAENGVTAMQVASREIHPDHEQENSEIKQIIDLLTEHGAPIDLFSAVAVGDEEQVHRLLKNDPKSANSRGPDGYPALHFAVGMNYKTIVEALLSAGGEVDIRNKSDNAGYVDETALHCAAFWGRYEIAKLLIDAGADVNALTDRKSTPLHDAARMTNTKLARLLLEKGAKPDARDKDNQTPLDWCRASNRNNAAEIEKVFGVHRAQNNN